MTKVSTDAAKDDFYCQLQDTWDTLPRSDINILMGDLNTHTGRDDHAWPGVLGPFGVGSINDSKTRFLSFAAMNDLSIGNTLFRHPLRHQLTWRSANGKDRASIDFIAISHRFRSSLQDVRVMRGADCGSDHYMVRLKHHQSMGRNPMSPFYGTLKSMKPFKLTFKTTSMPSPLRMKMAIQKHQWTGP